MIEHFVDLCYNYDVYLCPSAGARRKNCKFCKGADAVKAKSNKAVWIVVAAVVVIAAVIRLVNNQNTSDDVLFTDFIRSLLHIGLITAWGFSLYRRVVQKQARRYLCGIAVLMILWLNLKVLKYYICMDVNVSRYLWYLYYLPLVGIPLYMLYASLFIGKRRITAFRGIRRCCIYRLLCCS